MNKFLLTNGLSCVIKDDSSLKGVQKMKKITLLVSMILAFAFISANAQTEVSPEKQKAIKELSSLINADNKPEEMAKAMMGQFNSIQKDLVKGIINERNDLTVEERNELEKKLISDTQSATQKIQKRLFEKLEYNSMMEEIMTTVYDKYYTTEEINDLIAFYRTTTGQKALKVMQPLMLETMQITQAKLVPKVITVMQELREEQRLELAKRADELKPRRKKTE
jgi:uncharacterized protein